MTTGGPELQDVTVLLERWRNGDADAIERLMPLVYEELRKLAHARRWGERNNHTLKTTDLVHEAFLNMVDHKARPWSSRTHFFAAAARVMRHVLIDYARARGRQKRGGNQRRVTLDEGLISTDLDIAELFAIDEALTRLEQFDERACRIVEARYFVGLTIDETADVLGISPATVKRDWVSAKSWLRREIGEFE